MSSSPSSSPQDKPIKKEKTNSEKFTLTKLSRVIQKLNTFIDNPDTTYDNKREKSILYFKAFLDYIKKTPFTKADTLKLFYSFLTLNDKFYTRYGDEFTEIFFSHYNETDSHIELQQNNNTLPFHLYFIHLFFTNHSIIKSILDKQLLTFNNQTHKIEYNQPNLTFFPLETFTSENEILNIIICKIFAYAKLQSFYTSLTGLLMQVEGNVVKFYKLFSLFSLCLYQLEERERFIPSLLFIGGSIMTGLARSYLKTKGVLNENISYHSCSEEHKNHGGTHFPAKILLERDCDYLEIYFLPSMQRFCNIIFDNSNGHKKYWDDFYSHFSSCNKDNIDDVNDAITPNVKLFYYLMLYFCDFVFFFISNFTSNDINANTNLIEFTCKFEGFNEFIAFVCKYLTTNTRNIFSLWNYAYYHKHFLQTDCEKTEYILSDKPNTYGLSIIMLAMLTNQFKHNDNNNNDSMKHNYLPLICDRNVFSKCYYEIITFILHTENNARNKYFTEYDKMCIRICESIKHKGLLHDINDKNKNELISELTKANIDSNTIELLFK